MTFFWIVIPCIVWAGLVGFIWMHKSPVWAKAACLQLLADLPDADFVRLCQQMLHDQRGWTLEKASKARTATVNYVAQHNQVTYLIACVHRHGYQIGNNTINDLAANVRLRDGQSQGVLITEEDILPSVRNKATQEHIELLDGPRLWKMLQHYLPADYVTPSLSKVRKTVLLLSCAITVVALGFVGSALFFVQHTTPSTGPTQPVTATPKQHLEDLALSPAQIQARTKPQRETDPQTLEKSRREIAQTLLTIPGITHSAWISPNTLAIERTTDDDALWPAICNTLQYYPDLRAVRVQINARANTDEPVRWRQCATY